MMTTKPKSHPLNGAHTAGIFSDMSIDGPEIGTLVIIVDRAKNLPNRKTIGKQDPYCAARLGKEAKKTTTDIRGGQTPRWDQELRFTVHDSPDYYQLKVSVFNDDKKTDLIGEAWVDLRDIVVSGGGQNDLWQSLSCKGKYAGEIRVEITYYDTRPKPDKPASKPKPVPSDPDAQGSQQRPVKRRPLPSDPFRGPASAPATPDHMQTPPRPQPNPPSAFIPKQSPLQAVEYGTPPPQVRHFQQQDHYSPGTPNDTYATPPLRMSNSAPQHHRSADGHDSYPVHPDDLRYNPDHRGLPERSDPRAQYGQPADQFDRSPRDDPHWAPPDEDRPPPPPVHRSRNNSGNTQDMTYRSGYDLPPQHATPPTMRKDVLRNEAHRNSVPAAAYPGRPVYRGYDTAPSPPSNSPYGNSDPHQPSPPRHHSYDSSYDSHYRAMQPTVEDAPESPSPSVQDQFRRSGSRMPQYDEPEYNQVPSPAPLNLSGRHSASAGTYGAGAMVPQKHHGSYDYEPSESSVVSRISNPNSSQISYHSHSAPPAQNYAPYRNELADTQVTSSAKYSLPALPPVPPSLVPGVDPVLSMEVAHRINEDRRQDRRYPQPLVTPTRGRQMSDMSPNYGAGHGGSPQQFSTPQQSYDRSPISYSGGPSPQLIKPRAISPSPSPTAQHTIRRKSISPAPPTDGRRLSGIPFGPDSYDALNPALASTAPKEASRPDYNEINGKIITHDGKEVDPSDHLPMETWAPEPEPKGKKPAPSTSSRPSPAGAQPMPSAGRRPLRIANRPQSSAVLPPPAQYMSSDVPEPSPPPSTGRNRLQKKANRASVPVMSGANGGSSPLAPLPQHQDNFTPPRQLPRASTFDYPNENHAPMYGSSPGGRTHSSISAPPVPAKIPISKSGGLPMLPSSGGRRPGGDGDWALMEEMSRIDIGTGRARRHGHRGY